MTTKKHNPPITLTIPQDKTNVRQPWTDQPRVAPFVAILIAACLAVAGTAAGEPKTWSGDGGTPNWDDGDNWDPAGTPGADDDVTIPGDSGEILVRSPGKIEVKSLKLGDSENEDGTVLKGVPLPGGIDIKTTGDVEVGKNNRIEGGPGLNAVPDLSDGTGGKIKIDAGGDVKIDGEVKGGAGAEQKTNPPDKTDAPAARGGSVDVKAGGDVTVGEDGKVTGGSGGDSTKHRRNGASGGSVDVEGEGKVTNCGDIKGGEGGQGAPGGRQGRQGGTTVKGGSEVEVKPEGTVSGRFVRIKTDDGGTIKLRGLGEGAIKSETATHIDAGQNGTVDLRDNAAGSKPVKSGGSNRLRGEPQTDPGVDPEGLFDPTISYSVTPETLEFTKIVIEPPGGPAEQRQFIELQGAPFASFNGPDSPWIYVISGSPSMPGVVTHAVPLDGVALNANGLLLFRHDGPPLVPPPDVPATMVALWDIPLIPPQQAMTFVLARGMAVLPVGETLDADFDGVIDVPLENFYVLDAVSYNTPDEFGFEYAAQLGGDQLGGVGAFTPGALVRPYTCYDPFEDIFETGAGQTIDGWVGGLPVGDVWGPWSWQPEQHFGWDLVGVETPAGLPLQPGAPSAPFNCGTMGACCFDDGSCVEVLHSECDAEGGVFQGSATSCEWGCDAPRGSCCLDDGCAEIHAELCLLAEGEYFGDGSSCAETLCGPGQLPGDLNCDGVVDFDDIDPFVAALGGQEAYEAAYPNCNWLNADANGDGVVTFDDIDPFVALLGS